MEQGQVNELMVRIMKFPAASAYVTFLVDGEKYQYAIIVVMEGRIEFANYGDLIQSTSTEICFVKTATLIKAITNKPVKIFIVQFSEKFIQDNLYDVHAGTISKLFNAEISKAKADVNTFKVVKRLLLLLQKHNNGLSSANSPVIRKLTFNLLLSCISELKDVSMPQVQLAANYKVVISIKFLQMVEEFAIKQHGVKFYAAKLCTTQGNLTRIIKEVTGRVPKNIIEEALVQKAKAMLDNNLHTIYNVADELGFKSSSAFINFFRFHTGRTPNDYRNRKSRHL